MPGQSGQKWSLVAQNGVMRRREIRIQPIWMDHLWCDQADHENYDRNYERAARQNPERDSVKFRPHTTGWEGIVDGQDGKTAKTKRHKSDHVLSPCSEHTPKRSHRQYSRSSRRRQSREEWGGKVPKCRIGASEKCAIPGGRLLSGQPPAGNVGRSTSTDGNRTERTIGSPSASQKCTTSGPKTT
jgi:hypothetical protein